MRLIKFRVWHPDEWKMYYFEGCFKSMGEWIAYDGYRDTNSKEASAIWMQFTCLKDINDKDIYEGDVIMKNGIFKVVKWNEGQAGWNIKGGYGLSTSPKSTWEVVGNAYENSDLRNLSTQKDFLKAYRHDYNRKEE